MNFKFTPRERAKSAIELSSSSVYQHPLMTLSILLKPASTVSSYKSSNTSGRFSIKTLRAFSGRAASVSLFTKPVDVIKESLTTLGSYAFYGCKNLEEANLGEIIVEFFFSKHSGGK